MTKNDNPDLIVQKPESSSSEKNKSGCVKGQHLANVLKQQQPVVDQNTGRVTELCGYSCTDSLERRVAECTEKQLTAGTARQTEYHQK